MIGCFKSFCCRPMVSFCDTQGHRIGFYGSLRTGLASHHPEAATWRGSISFFWNERPRARVCALIQSKWVLKGAKFTSRSFAGSTYRLLVVDGVCPHYRRSTRPRASSWIHWTQHSTSRRQARQFYGMPFVENCGGAYSMWFIFHSPAAKREKD